MDEKTQASKRKVWLDCDPGHDDAFAIMLASHSEEIELVGISTTAGNQTIERTTTNALNVLNVIGSASIPVVAGQPQPLLRKQVICPEIHGASGLEGPRFPHHSLTVASSTPAFLYLHELLQKYPQQITLIATGPLTNFALLFVAFPQSVRLVRDIVLMGGAIGFGNTRPASEFNIEVDPEAAKIVFESGIPVTMVPLEVTHTALVTDHVLAEIRRRFARPEISTSSDNSDSATTSSSATDVAPTTTSTSTLTGFGQLIVDLLLFFSQTYREVFGFMEGPPLHDPCAVAYVLRPDLFECKLMRVDVDVQSELCYGRTVCDLYGMSSKPKNVNVALKMKVDQFWEVMLEALEKINRVSPLNQ
eukprot:TRINITY_DN6671_c0_g1_i1.p1 TRINITY_DN6671_c0_g1~~TRINITY_DN6671_c0_g1_i1.p1  ORF type:complete len:361 (-),score=105.99 TRINITY_DN6671_c0_g1_i1:39-1121(-)